MPVALRAVTVQRKTLHVGEVTPEGASRARVDLRLAGAFGVVLVAASFRWARSAAARPGRC